MNRPLQWKFDIFQIQSQRQPTSSSGFEGNRVRGNGRRPLTAGRTSASEEDRAARWHRDSPRSNRRRRPDPGSVYALIALGYTLVYGVVKLLNFAHGDVFMVG